MIAFTNPGLIDLRCLKAFGVNVKPNSDNPIGAFGSGAKFALAILLRLKHTITLYRGLDRYTFGLHPVTIRDKTFDFVTLTHPDGTIEEMPFNTHVGEHWKEWTPYRELASNALDEGGSTCFIAGNTYTPREHETAFVVEGDAIERAHLQRDTIFLRSSPILANEHIEVHQGQSNHVYYRGIRVLDLQSPSLYTYNLLDAAYGLTEDRTLKSEHDLNLRLGSLICATGDETFLERVITAPEGTLEHGLSGGWADAPAAPFLKVYSSLRRGGRMIELTRFADGAYLKANKHLPLPDAIPLTRIQQRQLEKAIAFCATLGWAINDFPIIVVPQERNGLMAWAQDKTIVLTTQCFDRGTKIVAQALIEEYLHLKHGFRDCSREFQTHLFQTIVTMGETQLGEPL